jgi:hypothetical protein
MACIASVRQRKCKWRTKLGAVEPAALSSSIGHAFTYAKPLTLNTPSPLSATNSSDTTSGTSISTKERYYMHGEKER